MRQADAASSGGREARAGGGRAASCAVLGNLQQAFAHLAVIEAARKVCERAHGEALPRVGARAGGEGHSASDRTRSRDAGKAHTGGRSGGLLCTGHFQSSDPLRQS